MTAHDWIELAVYLAVLTALAVPLGAYMAAVFEGRKHLLSPALGPLERLLYRLGGVRPEIETGWHRYAVGMLLFNVAGLLLVYLLQRLQAGLPLDP